MNGRIADLQSDDWARMLIAGWLSPSAKFIGTEIVEGKLCDLFEDSSGTKEWVWQRYRLPIQRIGSTCNKGACATVVQQKRNIEVNVPFADSLFDPPN